MRLVLVLLMACAQPRKEGILREWSEDGQLVSERAYVLGLKHGEQREWWPSGLPKLEALVFDRGHEGMLRTWYQNGALHEEMHYRGGEEEGPQRIYYEDGTLRSNYVVRNGRRYGSLGPKECQ